MSNRPLARRVEPRDLIEVVAMVHELASFQGATDKCQMTVERLYLALFRPQAALFGHVMELNNQLAGFALWYRSFSTWDSIFGIHLEDLYIRPQYRHQGALRCFKWVT